MVYNGLIFRRSVRRFLLAVLSMAALLLTVTANLGRAALPPEHSTIPAYAVKIAGADSNSGQSWGIWLYGTSKAETCWATKVSAQGLFNAEARCGAAAPPRAWQLAAQGSFGSRRHPESVLFFLTRSNVAVLRVQLSRGSDSSTRQLRLKSRRVPTSQARRGKLPGRVTYAVAVFPGSVQCVKSISAIDRSGERIGHSRHQDC